MADEPANHGAASEPNGASPRAVVDAEVVSQRLGDELVIVHLRTNRIFMLNRTAARFWELLDGDSDLRTIKEKMVEEFDVDERQLEVEFDDFLAALSREQLVDVRQQD
jgi:hypothetical protein